MTIDPENPVVRLCAAGMAIEGDAPAARALFAEAWALHRDDYEASIAAHFVARHQTTPDQTLHWNALAVRHAEAVGDHRVDGLLASLYLNLGESYRVLGRSEEAAAAVERASAALIDLPPGGYRDFVAGGIDRLRLQLPLSSRERIAVAAA
jgi:tetratricopeptide (TPR) repeat protein